VIVLDTNVYIAAFNDPVFGADFTSFHREHLPRMALSAVVAHELLVGARTPDRRRALRRGLLEPFRTRGRMHVPSMSTWERAADLDRRLRDLGGLEGSLRQRSFGNDLLLAATARELGATLITLNLADFQRIARVVPLKIALPWPSLPRT
jgi:predicted nucleic acid-binding protein